jgi:uncharacterized protein YeaO (DUF488 family)
VTISLRRAYESPTESDGCRILVERLWPRGVSKEDARIDLWSKDVAPSTALRKWFDHDPGKWDEFKRRYFAELESQDDALAAVVERARAGAVTFVFGSRETRFNNATALKEYVERVLDA